MDSVLITPLNVVKAASFILQLQGEVLKGEPDLAQQAISALSVSLDHYLEGHPDSIASSRFSIRQLEQDLIQLLTTTRQVLTFLLPTAQQQLQHYLQQAEDQSVPSRVNATGNSLGT